MSPRKKTQHQNRHIRIRSVRRDPPDLKKIARALIALAQAQAEADAEAEHDNQSPAESPDNQPPKLGETGS